jgi:SAM-dependent methyltransferase
MTSQADPRRRLLAHYEQDGLLERIDAGLTALGENPAEPSLESLSLVDEFHIRGRAATLELIERMDVSRNDRVLDVGSGLGGPARQLAAATGAHVTGVDISAEYCAIASTLSARTGLGDRSRFVTGEAAGLSAEDTGFDAAWSIHVGMNVADKEGFYAAVLARLRPGARFIVYDMARGTGPEPKYPMPWARSPADGFLATCDELRIDLQFAGFTVDAVEDDTAAALAFIRHSIARAQAASAPAPLGPHTVLGPIFREIAPNLLHGFAAGGLEVCRLTCARPG